MSSLKTGFSQFCNVTCVCFVVFFLMLQGPVLFAQTTTDVEMEELVWQAAREFETGNTEDARQLLESAIATSSEPPSPRLATLIDQLSKAIKLTEDDDAEPVNTGQATQRDSLIEAARQEMLASGFKSADDLEAYVSGISEAASALFE